MTAARDVNLAAARVLIRTLTLVGEALWLTLATWLLRKPWTPEEITLVTTGGWPLFKLWWTLSAVLAMFTAIAVFILWGGFRWVSRVKAS